MKIRINIILQSRRRSSKWPPPFKIFQPNSYVHFSSSWDLPHRPST